MKEHTQIHQVSHTHRQVTTLWQLMIRSNCFIFSLLSTYSKNTPMKKTKPMCVNVRARELNLSIHYLYRLSLEGRRVAGAKPSIGREAWYTVASVLQGWQTNNHSHLRSIKSLQLTPPPNLHVFGPWKEDGESTQTQREHADSTEKDLGWTVNQWGCSANHCPAVLPQESFSVIQKQLKP